MYVTHVRRLLSKIRLTQILIPSNSPTPLVIYEDTPDDRPLLILL